MYNTFRSFKKTLQLKNLHDFTYATRAPAARSQPQPAAAFRELHNGSHQTKFAVYCILASLDLAKDTGCKKAASTKNVAVENELRMSWRTSSSARTSRNTGSRRVAATHSTPARPSSSSRSRRVVLRCAGCVHGRIRGRILDPAVILR